MKRFNFRLSPSFMSDIIWRQIFENIEREFQGARGHIEDILAACDSTRTGMAYNTGSISLASAFSLYGLVRFVRPSTIFEIGTFIGRSTLSMAAAMDVSGDGGHIYTCDGSNDALLPPGKVKCPITTYPRTMSHDALQRFTQEGRQIDMLHIDGRIASADLDIITKHSNPRVVVALDDFEGNEKGVANLALMRTNPFFRRHALVYPAPDALMARLGSGILVPSLTAVLIPFESIIISAQ